VQQCINSVYKVCKKCEKVWERVMYKVCKKCEKSVEKCESVKIVWKCVKIMLECEVCKNCVKLDASA